MGTSTALCSDGTSTVHVLCSDGTSTVLGSDILEAILQYSQAPKNASLKNGQAGVSRFF